MKKIALALALLLLPASAQSTPTNRLKSGFPQKSDLSEKTEVRLEQQKSKWAPNGMKVLIIHGKRHWVEEGSLPTVENREFTPILKEGV